MAVGPVVYLNGAFVAANEARISPFDRGFLFAHAAYEVTAVYGGRLIDFEAHAARLARTLDALDIPPPMDAAELEALHGEMIARNEMREGLVYLQATGGAYGFRDFAGPETFEPALFLFAAPRRLITEKQRDGVSVISAPDERWARRDLKTTQLLASTLAYRRSRDAGAETAILHEDGVVTEGASANAWIVTPDGRLATRDLSRALLPGVTRSSLERLARAAGLEIDIRAFTLDEMRGAAEAFTSSTGNLILPITQLDGAPIGSGAPGPVTRAAQRLYYEHLGADAAVEAPWAAG